MTQKDKVQEIIDNSGNTFHSQVVTFLRKRGWDVLISPYYSDIHTNKPREIDIIAEKNYDVTTRKKGNGILCVQLFIECKYIKKETVFWFDDKDISSAEDMLIKTTCLRPHIENITIEKHHYYWTNKVAKLFSSSKTPQKLHESEEFYRSLNQTLNGMIYLRRRGSISKNTKSVNYNFTCNACYPIILCNEFSNFYRTDIGQNNFEEINDHFEFEVNYSYRQKLGVEVNEYFLIDVVNFINFEEYLNKIYENDREAMIGAKF